MIGCALLVFVFMSGGGDQIPRGPYFALCSDSQLTAAADFGHTAHNDSGDTGDSDRTYAANEYAYPASDRDSIAHRAANPNVDAAANRYSDSTTHRNSNTTAARRHQHRNQPRRRLHSLPRSHAANANTNASARN